MTTATQFGRAIDNLAKVVGDSVENVFAQVSRAIESGSDLALDNLGVIYDIDDAIDEFLNGVGHGHFGNQSPAETRLMRGLAIVQAICRKYA